MWPVLTIILLYHLLLYALEGRYIRTTQKEPNFIKELVAPKIRARTTHLAYPLSTWPKLHDPDFNYNRDEQMTTPRRQKSANKSILEYTKMIEDILLIYKWVNEVKVWLKIKKHWTNQSVSCSSYRLYVHSICIRNT